MTRRVEPMPGRCYSCAHWNREGDSDWGLCQRIVDEQNRSRTYQESRAYVQDAEGYDAWLTTHRAFGCVLHEEERNQS